MNIVNPTVKALDRTIVVAQSNDGDVWAGTDVWLIREASVLRPKSDAMDALLDSYDVTLTWEEHDGYKILVRSYAGLYRAYVRDDQDGTTVWIDDAYATVVERLLGGIDEEGEFVPAALQLKQSSANVLGPVGVFGNETLAGIIMPARRP